MRTIRMEPRLDNTSTSKRQEEPKKPNISECHKADLLRDHDRQYTSANDLVDGCIKKGMDIMRLKFLDMRFVSRSRELH